MKNNIKYNKKLIWVFFILSIVIWSLFSIHLKVFNFYPDEIRFYDMARNILNGDWFIARGEHIDYQKVLYSLLLAPFFNIKNIHIRLFFISLINALFISCSVFPITSIKKIIDRNDENKELFNNNLIFILLLFNPMFLYTTTFLSENLYIPLFFFSLLLFLKYIDTKKVIYIILSSVLFFLTYICREIMAVFFVAIIISYLYIYIFKNHTENEKGLLNKKFDLRIIFFILIPFLLYIISKIVLFKDVAYQYVTSSNSQITLDAIMSLKGIFYFIYGIGYYFSAFFLIFLFIPITVLINEYKNMLKIERFILISQVVNIILLIFTVVYTISIREDINKEIIRLHLRYFIPSITIIYYYIFKYLNMESIKNSLNNLKLRKILIFMIIIFLVFFRGIQSYVFDTPYLFLYTLIDDIVKFLTGDIFIDLIRGFVIIFIIILISFIVFKAYKKSNFKKIYNILISVFILCVASNLLYGGYKFIKAQTISKQIIYEVEKLNNINELNNSNILVITEKNGTSNLTRAIDIYFENHNKIMFQDANIFVDKNIKEELDKIIDMKDPIFKFSYKNFKKIEYIIVENANFTPLIDFDGLEILDDSNRSYIIYKNNMI